MEERRKKFSNKYHSFYFYPTIFFAIQARQLKILSKIFSFIFLLTTYSTATWNKESKCKMKEKTNKQKLCTRSIIQNGSERRKLSSQVLNPGWTLQGLIMKKSLDFCFKLIHFTHIKFIHLSVILILWFPSFVAEGGGVHTYSERIISYKFISLRFISYNIFSRSQTCICNM